MKKYRINEIFYSLQGEGHNVGRAAVFIRFSGCNLKCPFCDTDFDSYTEMTAAEIVATAHNLIGDVDTKPMIVLTGGEPTLQVDAILIDALHSEGFNFVAMESNGTNLPPQNLDWLTISPKGKIAISKCDELKCIFSEKGILAQPDNIDATYKYVQPCDTGNAEINATIVSRCIDFIKCNPSWRLSLQTHKLTGFK